MITIYSIVNTIDNKRYVGISSDYKNRKRLHIWGMKNGKHKNIKIKRAVNKYGFDNFVFEVLEELESEDRMLALEKEHHYINKYNSYHKGYNQSEGFESSFLYKESKETKEKRRKLMKGNTYWLGRKHTEETKKKIGLIHKGKVVSAETRFKTSESRKGMMKGEDNPFYGKKHNEKTKEIIRAKLTASKGTKVQCVETGQIFNSISECAKTLNCDRRNIRRVCEGVCKQTKGYTFTFVTDMPINYQSEQETIGRFND